MRRILEGLRVLDITQLVAGPYCGRMLADLGADVIKIDVPAARPQHGPVRTAGAASQNLGKRSIVLNLKQPEGLRIALQLAQRADVLVENFLPGVMTRLALGYDELSGANPRLIYVSISGFGQDTSSSQRRAFGATAHAEAGLLWVQQQAAGTERPFPPGFTVADIAAGMNAGAAVLAALYDRERTGKGARIDISLMDSQLAMLAEVAGDALNGTSETDWKPFRHGLQAAKDGYLAINAGGPRVWRRTASAFGHPETLPASQAEADALLQEWVSERTVAEAASALEEAGAPYGVMRSMPDAVNDPYFQERGMIRTVPDVLDGSVRAIANPLHLGGAEVGPWSGVPLAGQHTREILSGLGLADGEVQSLIESGAATEATRA